MNPDWPTAPRIYDVDERPAKKRVPAIVQEPRSSTPFWLAICAGVGLACGLIGWALRGGNHEAAADAAATRAAPTVNVRALAPDVTNSPFARSDASAPLVEKPASPTLDPPPLPFVVVRSWLDDDGERFVQLTRGGQGILARGLRVHGDYLVQVEQDMIEFTYLGATRRQSIPLPASGQRPANSAGPAQPWEYRPRRF